LTLARPALATRPCGVLRAIFAWAPGSHGTCSLSVTREYLGLGGGPPGFTRDFSGPVLLGIPLGSRKGFAYRGITFCADDFHASSATNAISYSLPDQQLRLSGPATPITQRLLAITRNRFGLFPFRSPLLRESRLLSLPVGTEMFHFPTLPPPALCVQAGATGHYTPRGIEPRSEKNSPHASTYVVDILNHHAELPSTGFSHGYSPV